MNKDTVSKLGIKIRIERQKAKISQEKLAELSTRTFTLFSMFFGSLIFYG